MIWMYRLFCIIMMCSLMYFFVIHEMKTAKTSDERATNVIGFFGGMGVSFFLFLLALTL